MTTRNYTEYSGPSEWLRETYPPIHAVWTESFSSQDPSMMTFELKCMICELKPSTGVHYGVKMCEADKQFLKRTFHYRIVYSDCKKDLAVCPPRPRGWCQMCRLRKCLSLPVNINLIRIGNKTNKSKVKEEPTQISITVIPPPVPLVEQTEFSNLDYNIKSLPSLEFFQYREPRLIPDYQIDCSQPLDLSVKRRETPPVAETDWFSDELLFTAFPDPGHVFLPPNKPLDLSPYCSTADFTDFFLAPDSDPVARRTPSPVLETSQSFYKLSVNSTLLGDALSRIQSNISMSASLVNLSSVSDILTENDK